MEFEAEAGQGSEARETTEYEVCNELGAHSFLFLEEGVPPEVLWESAHHIRCLIN